MIRKCFFFQNDRKKTIEKIILDEFLNKFLDKKTSEILNVTLCNHLERMYSNFCVCRMQQKHRIALDAKRMH